MSNKAEIDKLDVVIKIRIPTFFTYVCEFSIVIVILSICKIENLIYILLAIQKTIKFGVMMTDIWRYFG